MGVQVHSFFSWLKTQDSSGNSTSSPCWAARGIHAALKFPYFFVTLGHVNQLFGSCLRVVCCYGARIFGRAFCGNGRCLTTVNSAQNRVVFPPTATTGRKTTALYATPSQKGRWRGMDAGVDVSDDQQGQGFADHADQRLHPRLPWKKEDNAQERKGANGTRKF